MGSKFGALSGTCHGSRKPEVGWNELPCARGAAIFTLLHLEQTTTHTGKGVISRTETISGYIVFKLTFSYGFMLRISLYIKKELSRMVVRELLP